MQMGVACFVRASVSADYAEQIGGSQCARQPTLTQYVKCATDTLGPIESDSDRVDRFRL